MAAEIVETPFRYRGQASTYVDIAVRGLDEHLGIALQYAKHPSGIGCFIIRFVTHGTEATPHKYTHFTFRADGAQFLSQTEAAHHVVFEGIRLNKFAIPVFKPAVGKQELDHFALKFNVWNLLEEWVIQQATAEGFTVTVDVQKELRRLVVPEPTPEVAVESILSFPDFQSPEYQEAAKGQVEKPKPDPVEDEDGEDEESDDDKEWLQ